jgi:hypothetical protein
MTRTYDDSPKGIERRFTYATNHLEFEVKQISEEVGETVVLAALFTSLRDLARECGMAPCAYQALLIDELALMNKIRRSTALGDAE